MAVLTKTSGYTVTTSDFSGCRLMLVVNFSSAATITLPAASNSGYVLMIKNIGSAPRRSPPPDPMLSTGTRLTSLRNNTKRLSSSLMEERLGTCLIFLSKEM